jgi:hypothetical protein
MGSGLETTVDEMTSGAGAERSHPSNGAEWRIPWKQWMLTAELVDSENRQMAELLLLILLLVL